MTKVGIIGVGMVGKAVLQVFEEAGVKCVPYDKFLPNFNDQTVHFEALLECDFIFVCVPTPTLESGAQDVSALIEVFERLTRHKYSGIVVSKCTTLPGTLKSFAQKYNSFKLVHYPEFLRAAHAYDDFKYQKAILVSGQDMDATLKTAEFLREVFPRTSIKTYFGFASTEIAKYLHNCFIPVKISLLNEFYDICDIYHVNFDSVIQGVEMMGRIGETDLRVPGPDGKRGWGGACFAKDTKAIAHIMGFQGIQMETVYGAIKSNERVRK